MTAAVPLLPRRWRWGAVVAVAAAILVASVVDPPTTGVPTTGPLGLVGLDKWLHGLAYAGLAGAAAYALAGETSPRRVVLGAALMGIAYGLGIELLQLAFPARAFDPTDLAANAVGACLSAGTCGVVLARTGIGRGGTAGGDPAAVDGE